ncbi:hypothetical protein L3X38_026683 [Prunus dulcis]|uniref:No apical meristem-associated C-terminal domain-containing protein n=1 Tax=Prunus dulcis TaxID=3755 RepID=A0AAD4VP11_PRUDU|nr:hypothetical protein L3X38_026683 [Prunus dulcis]
MSTKSQRGVNWRPEEDEALCKGWVSISEDEVVGTNQDVHAKTIFLIDNKPLNRPFKLYHAWKILKDCPKWNNINDPLTQRSSGASASMVNLDNDVDNIAMPSPRPEGWDKQKAAQKKGKTVNLSQQTRDSTWNHWLSKALLSRRIRDESSIYLTSLSKIKLILIRIRSNNIRKPKNKK